MAKKSVNENVYYNEMYLKGIYVNPTKAGDGVSISLLFANNEKEESKKEKKYKYFYLTEKAAQWTKASMAQTIQDFNPDTKITEDSKLTPKQWAEELLQALEGEAVTIVEVPNKNDPRYTNTYINKPSGGGLRVIVKEEGDEPETDTEEEIDLSDVPFN